ncbi:hypothetical protein S40285_05279 [Stachybotrys chlorohalonatus IBT 40285]|uniref:C2H2-type domain-containing protein n=1 Tax=Stachybotrys chlorohalonatus (strain IBT 40285) TaxID=1283841 RepID=A0A084QL84_STAC4|nr:hypothetical protein S40285_05279 [Stachybotrys chlorohalonata IBT 40285]
MASMTEQPYGMYQQQHETDQYARYPDPAQNVFSCGPSDMSISADAFGAYQRPSHDAYPTTLGFEPSLFAEAPNYLLNRTSPGMYPEDGELRLSSSSLSSAPSATSSAISSPQSHHGQMGPLSDWSAHPLDIQPTIVGNDYVANHDYSGFHNPGMEELNFNFVTKQPGFVGEFPAASSVGSQPPSPGHHSSLTPMSLTPLAVSTSIFPKPSMDTSNGASVFSPLSGPSFSLLSSETLPHLCRPATNHGRVSSPRTPRASFHHTGGHFSAPLDSCWSRPNLFHYPMLAKPAANGSTLTDPSLIHPEANRPPLGVPPFEPHFQHPTHHYPVSPSAASSSPQPPMLRTSSASPFHHNAGFQNTFNASPFSAPMDSHTRRPSVTAFISPTSNGDYHSGDETKEKQRCTYPDCGKTFKDLKAHMLTHQTERPEKCPIQTCEYHVKGFARKYDKNRHTLTHYKGNMVCGFCPGSGSAAEKSFNRADVFKRHLTAVHGVEQTPPNSRKKTSNGLGGSGKKLSGYAPDATGKCSTCSQTFSNAQDFYEHLDDCVLRIVQQEDPAEAINAQRLAEVENDKIVHQTLEKNNLPTTTQTTSFAEEDDDYDMADEEDIEETSRTCSPATKKKTNPAGGVQKSRGLTHSRGGVNLATKTKGRKHRRDYPTSWGFDKGRMTMKKRVMAVFDGPRRLAKDDMMLCTDHEVRIRLADGKSYITDLDVQTLRRAEAFHNATEDEKGPWISDDPTEEQLNEMRQMLATSPASV